MSKSNNDDVIIKRKPIKIYPIPPITDEPKKIVNRKGPIYRLPVEPDIPVKGEGIKEVINKLIYGDNSYPQDVKKMLDVNGDSKILKCYALRDPVRLVITDLINVVSMNQFQSNLKKQPYDKLFHLSFQLELSKVRW